MRKESVFSHFLGCEGMAWFGLIDIEVGASFFSRKFSCHVQTLWIRCKAQVMPDAYVPYQEPGAARVSPRALNFENEGPSWHKLMIRTLPR